jgi:thiamine pyrophosphate-dependent acetolactate synthase large subunit-like protein
VLIAGHGARQATGQIQVLAERLSAPVLTSFKAKGLVPDTHPLGAGVLGRSGTPVASWLMNEADLLIVVGASFSSLGRYLESKGQPVLMSGYLGSIGFGYPAALGAWAAAPGRPSSPSPATAATGSTPWNSPLP